MLKSFLTASALALGTVFVAAPAHALSFNWSYRRCPGPTGANPYVVKGTISGLVIGSNSGNGITATVTNTPTGDLVGTVFNNFGYTSIVGGDAFTVDAGGNVIFADAFYTSGPTSVIFFGGYGGYTTEIYSTDTWATSSQITYTPIAAAVPFEFNPALGLSVLGGVLAAKKLSGKLIKKK